LDAAGADGGSGSHDGAAVHDVGSGIHDGSLHDGSPSGADALAGDAAHDGGGAPTDSSSLDGSTGCGKAATMTGAGMGSIAVGSQMRTYRTNVPTNYAPANPIPLVFGFHGRGGDGSQAESWGMQTAAATAGQAAIFLFPDGLDQGGATGWDESDNGVDVAFFDALVSWAESTFCIDTRRIFVAGFSWGTDFSNALSCFRGTEIRAVNGFSGGFYSSGCTSTVPAYRATYSTPDGTDAYPQSDFDAALAHYRQAHGCTTATQSTAPSPCLAYQGCSLPVIYCAYPNMGHAVPPNGGADAWSFFASLP
jgi:poly(3-hydroxybutyrate) depolymerase